ncbi:MAG: four helix bundle protein [Nitrospirota bacterium]|jgi:four helix bundle protein
MQNEKFRVAKEQPDIMERTYAFALSIVRLCQQLDKKPGVNRILALQLLRSGTSIGANVEEAQAGQSKADFSSKISIALKEARETRYWLRLIGDSGMVDLGTLGPLRKEADELSKILGAIASRSKQ